MGRPVNNQGFFCNERYQFDAETKEQFEKIKIHSYITEVVEEKFEEYSSEQVYAVYDKVSFKGKNYICKEEVAEAEEFNNAKWEEYKAVGGLEEAVIVRQVGYNKYLVASLDGQRLGVVRLVKKSEATEVGLGYILAIDGNAKEHSVVKLLKNKVLAYVDDAKDEVEVYSFSYEIESVDGKQKASFEPVSSEVDVILETIA